jgi:hypothetical protein
MRQQIVDQLNAGFPQATIPGLDSLANDLTRRD